MDLRFFPRDTQFWLYHCGAALFIIAVTLATVFLWGEPGARSIASSVVWLAPYTLAVLCFRWIYKKRQWKSLAMGRFIPIVLIYGTVSGMLVVAVASAMVMPFFWDGIVVGHPGLDVRQYLLRTIISDGLQGQLFICAWIFIYTSVTGDRRIAQAEVLNLRLQNSLKEAQLSSLANQLNPHFLFNSLNNIRFMIHENAERADSMVVALSEILRYSLGSSEQDKVRLSDEVEIIERYLAIVKVQFEERLQVELRVPEQLRACLLPPMVVQMFVENAIKHGIDQLQLGGALSIAVSDQEGQLLVVVANDTPTAANVPAPGMDIGLRNIERRLHLLYGDKAALHTRRESGRFIVTMAIPKEM